MIGTRRKDLRLPWYLSGAEGVELDGKISNLPGLWA